MAFGFGKSIFVRDKGDYDLSQEAQRVGGRVRLPWVTPIERLFKAPDEIHEPSLWEKEEAVEDIGPILFIRRNRLYLAKNVPGKRKEVFHTKKWIQLWPGRVYAATMIPGRVYFTTDRIKVFVGQLVGDHLENVQRVSGLQGFDTVLAGEHYGLVPWPGLVSGVWHRSWMSTANHKEEIILTCLERLMKHAPHDWKRDELPYWKQDGFLGAIYSDLAYPYQGAIVRYGSNDGVNFSLNWRAVDHEFYGYWSKARNPDWQGDNKGPYQLLYDNTDVPLLVPYNTRLPDAGQAVRVKGLEEEDNFSSFKARVSPYACMIMSGRGVVLKTSDGGKSWRHFGYFTIRDPDTGVAVTSDCQIMPADRM